MARIDWDRYVPTAERRTALWLAGTIAAMAFLAFARGFFPPSSERWWQPHVAFAAVYVVSAGLLLLLARSRLHAPAVVAGFVVAHAFVALPVRVFETGVRLAMEPLWAGASPTPSTMVRTLFAVTAPYFAVYAGIAVVLAVMWMRRVDIEPSGAEDTDSWPAVRGAFLSAIGMAGDGCEPGRRIALAFLAVSAALGVASSVLAVPFVVLQARLLSDPAAGPEWVQNLLGPVQALAVIAVATLIVWSAVARFGAPRSVWLAPVATLAAGLVTGVAGPLIWLPALLRDTPDAGIIASTALREVGIQTLVQLAFALVYTAAVLAAVRLAVSRPSAAPVDDAAVS